MRPDYDGGALPSVGRSLLRAAGVEADGAPVPLAPPLRDGLDPFGGRRSEGPVVLVLIDSLGWCAFRDSPALERPGLVEWAEAARPITSVFPSTTTAALTALSTATPPGRNGIVGHRQYLPRWGVVADMLRLAPMTTPGQDTLLGAGWTPRDLTPAPTIFELGLRGVVISRDKFARTGFTRLLYHGAEYRPYSTASDLAVELVGVLGRAEPPDVILVYWDELDTVHHLRGPDPALFDLELERVRSLLAWAAERVAPERRRATQLWVTGDHGQVPATEAANVALDREERLMARLTHPPSGDRRAGFFEVGGGEVGAFREELLALLPSGSLGMPMAEAVDEGLFGPGPYHAELARRTGNLLVLPASPAGLTYAAPGDPVPRRIFAGAHSGLEREELWVPFIAGPFDELARTGRRQS